MKLNTQNQWGISQIKREISNKGLKRKKVDRISSWQLDLYHRPITAITRKTNKDKIPVFERYKIDGTQQSMK